ncbi:MAG: adaptor protein MecA [Clostridia bacterium]|nr:adaptor protein MecA [Clostridia bacterium]
MKIEKITDNKIRIILNLDDLEAKNIDLHSFMSNSIESQSLFVDMLDEAERTVGFYTKDSKILIEALASSEGLFIFTITKVEEESSKRKNLRIKRKNTNINYKKVIYKFESFDEFCNFCTYISNSNFGNLNSLAKNNSLYFYDNKYYLIITDINLNYTHVKGFFATISEFAKPINHPETFETKLSEYGTPIMKRNSIKRCNEYFG